MVWGTARCESDRLAERIPKHERAGKRPIRQHVRKLKREDVLSLVRERLLELAARLSRRNGRHLRAYFTVEGLATELQVEPAKVHWSFMVLRNEGIVSKGENHAPHDSPRDPMCPGGDSRWDATKYYLKRDEDDPYKGPFKDIPFDSPELCMRVWHEEKE